MDHLLASGFTPEGRRLRFPTLHRDPVHKHWVQIPPPAAEARIQTTADRRGSRKERDEHRGGLSRAAFPSLGSSLEPSLGRGHFPSMSVASSMVLWVQRGRGLQH